MGEGVQLFHGIISYSATHNTNVSSTGWLLQWMAENWLENQKHNPRRATPQKLTGL